MDGGIEALRCQLREAVEECSARGLVFSTKWAAEQLCSLPSSDSLGIDTEDAKDGSVPAGDTKATPTLKHRLRGAGRPSHTTGTTESETEQSEQTLEDKRMQWQQLDTEERDRMALGKSLFDVREFERAAFMLQGCHGPRAVFLRLYSLYLNSERCASEAGENKSSNSSAVAEISAELLALDAAGDLDGFGVYLLALSLKASGRREEARDACLRAVQAFECNWSAWELLAGLAGAQAATVCPASGWVRHAFLAQALVAAEAASAEFDGHVAALERLVGRSGFVMGLRAQRHYHMREFDEAGSEFAALQALDPFRLELSDVHSNILYVTEDRGRLAALAQRCAAVDRFRPETCCVIGNYYSLRREHDKAAGYFRRAAQLDSACLAAWVLLGHELIELKNTAGAADAYRRAADIDARDYRAWYGLGKTYEMLNMPHYALRYYARAAALRPHDSRMWCALADCYDRAAQPDSAIACYRRALHASPESAAHAAARLARLYAAAGDRPRAAHCYRLLLAHAATDAADDVASACLFLASFELDRRNPRAARQYLSQVADAAPHRAEEASAMLRAMASSSN
ncbi:anaphase-promoting complex component apc8 [Coemansia pectinata]|uniref:Anaphase-promoting complex component apc8 n=1 Tax=Coemansia pectinata TaxID=1052879 RepID=A0A9W8H0U3_9FUNG|nr:anaphase-promoting complex component apc8 [Coemansia pectinata]